MLKTQLNESARERETLRADKEQERERRKNTEKELRQVEAKYQLLTKGVIKYLVSYTYMYVCRHPQVVERQTASTSSQDQVEKDELNQSISNLKR